MSPFILHGFQDELQKIASDGPPLIPHTEVLPGMKYPTTRFIPDPNWSPPSAAPEAASAAPIPAQGMSRRATIGALAIPVAAGLYAMHRRKKNKQQAQG